MSEPPTTLPARDVAASARLLALADELAEHTEEARRRLTALAPRVERLAALAEAPAPAAEPHQPSPLSPTARLIAVELALAGEPRDRVAGLLTRVFAVDDADAALDDLYD